MNNRRQRTFIYVEVSPSSSPRRQKLLRGGLIGLVAMAVLSLPVLNEMFTEWSILHSLGDKGQAAEAKIVSKSKERSGLGNVYIIKKKYFAAKPPWPMLAQYGKGPWLHESREEVSECDFHRLQPGQTVKVRFLPEHPGISRLDGNCYKRNKKLAGSCLYFTLMALLGLLLYRGLRPSLSPARLDLLKAATMGLLVMLLVGYVGCLAEGRLACAGVAMPINGGMTGVMVGAAAGFAVFLQKRAKTAIRGLPSN